MDERQNFIPANIFLSSEISKNIQGLLFLAISMFLEIFRSIKTSLGDFVIATSNVFLKANNNDRIDQLAPFSVSTCLNLETMLFRSARTDHFNE